MADVIWSLLIRNTTFPVDSLHTLNLHKFKISLQKISAKKTILQNRRYKDK